MKKTLLLFGGTLLMAASVNAQTSRVEQREVKVVNKVQINAVEDEIAVEEAEEATPEQRAAMRARRKAAPSAGEAYYYRPAGTFYAGTNTKTGSYYAPILCVPPYKNIEYKAQNADSYQWVLQMYNSGSREWYSATTQSLAVGYNTETDSVPVLAVGESAYHIGGYTAATSTVMDRWSMLYSVPDPQTYFYSATNGYTYYVSPKFFAYRDRDNIGGGTMYYTGAKAAENSSTGKGYWYGRNENGYGAMGLYVEKPDNSYALRGVSVKHVYSILNMAAGTTAELKATVYKVEEHSADTLALGDAIKVATYTLSADDSANPSLIIPFDEAIEIDDEIVIVISGYNNENVNDFSMYVARDTWDEGHGQHGYAFVLDENGNPVKSYSLKNYLSVDRGVTAPSIFMDVVFPFVIYYYTTESGEREFTVEGAAKTSEVVDLWSSAKAADLKVALEDGSELPSWVTVSVADIEGSNYHKTVTINVEANTGDAREAKIKVGTVGDNSVVTVKQDANTTGVVNTSVANKLASVKYYDVSGAASTKTPRGLNVEVKTYTDGSRKVVKYIK